MKNASKKSQNEEIYVKGHLETVHNKMDYPMTRRHIPPHERKNIICVEFDEQDWNIFKAVFGDEDTADAAINIILNAPPEIQIVAIQVLKMIEEVL